MAFSRLLPPQLRLHPAFALTRGLALLALMLLASAGQVKAQDTEVTEAQVERAGGGDYVLTVPELVEPSDLDRRPWDLQWNTRIGMGFGAMRSGGQGFGFIFEMIGRIDALWGQPGDEHARVGIGLDLRGALSAPPTMGDSFDMAGVLVGLFPTWRGFPILLSAGGGYAFRNDSWKNAGGDGGIFLGTFAWGYRSYNHANPSHYQIAILAYFSTRIHTDVAQTYEMTAGFTFDMALAFYTPVMWVSQKIAGSPDDPLPEESDEWRTEPAPTAAPGFDPDARFEVPEDDEDDESSSEEDDAQG